MSAAVVACVDQDLMAVVGVVADVMAAGHTLEIRSTLVADHSPRKTTFGNFASH